MENQKLLEIESAALAAIASAETTGQLNDVKNNYLSKKSELSQMSSLIGKLPTPEEKKEFGNALNVTRNKITSALDEKFNKLQAEELNKKLEAETIDISLPGKNYKTGARNPFYIIKHSKRSPSKRYARYFLYL